MKRLDDRHGQAAFDNFYGGIYGERWSELRACLAPRDIDSETSAGASDSKFELSEGLLRSYFLDEASVAAAEALGVSAGDEVLDMCAAPGGKSLVLSLRAGRDGTVAANERSASRRARLIRVLDTHLPAELRERISVTGHDARKWGLYERDRYDRVLLDAPCSSEAHVLGSPHHLSQWSASRTKTLAHQSHAMLAAAVDAVRPGGTVLYSTCTISPVENDEVVERLMRKRGTIIEVLSRPAPWGEATTYGWQIFPDRCGGRGPIYYALLRKRKSS